MARKIFLITYPSYPFKDHWGFWIPSTADDRIGKVIHVTGDVRAGFEQEIKRHYDLRDEQRSNRITLLGQIGDEYVKDDPSDGNLEIDIVARDHIEQIAFSIAAPGPSMNSTTTKKPPAQRVNFSDCQWWICQVVEKLVQEGLLDASARVTLQNAPNN